jgi:uncharacterized protein
MTSSWYLHSYGRANTPDGDGTLSTIAPTMEPIDSFVCGVIDIDNRVGPLHYTSPVFVTRCTVDGATAVDLHASSSRNDSRIVVAVFDVQPDGHRRQLATGRAMLAGDHVRVECDSVSHTFEIGHRVGVEVLADSGSGLAAIQVFHDAVRPSALVLSVAPQTDLGTSSA